MLSRGSTRSIHTATPHQSTAYPKPASFGRTHERQATVESERSDKREARATSLSLTRSPNIWDIHCTSVAAGDDGWSDSKKSSARCDAWGDPSHLLYPQILRTKELKIKK